MAERFLWEEGFPRNICDSIYKILDENRNKQGTTIQEQLFYHDVLVRKALYVLPE